MAHQEIQCSHCGERHGRAVCDGCYRELGRDEEQIQLQNIQLVGNWSEEIRAKQTQYGMNHLLLCAHCAGSGVDLLLLLTVARRHFEPRQI